MRVLSAVLALAAVAGPTMAADPANWAQPMQPFRIADNLYYVGTAGLTSLLITTPKGHILIDGAVPVAAKGIKANIAALGFKPADVKILLNSHAHFDHSGGLAELKADTGAKMFASAGDKAALETGTYPGWEDRKHLDFAPVKVDRVLKDGDKVELGGVTLTAHLTPGHSAGCTTWTFPLKVDGKVRQVIYHCSTSVALNRLVSKDKGPQYPGIVGDYLATFAKLKAMKADVFLAPHAESFRLADKRARLGTGPNPFVDPSELAAAVASSERDFNKALAKQQEAAR